ncbi:MAG: 2Fe-2S iron-sulfur cluster-binding protein [Anaerovoracaceae bacterium]
MKIKLKIQRQDSEKALAYWQSFVMEAEENLTRKIIWECSCNQKICGSCAMVINGVPMLACGAFVGAVAKKGEIELSPLKKFATICDLKVDRSDIYEYMKEMKLWLTEDAVVNERENNAQYLAASCALCGCCLEVCTNYTGKGSFYGAAIMNQTFRVSTQEGDASARKGLLKKYSKHGSGGCSKSLACEKICPQKLPLGITISKMNKLKFKERLTFGGK